MARSDASTCPSRLWYCMPCRKAGVLCLRHYHGQDQIQHDAWHECREHHYHGIGYAYERGVNAEVFGYSCTDATQLDVGCRACQSFVHNVYCWLSHISCDKQVCRIMYTVPAQPAYIAATSAWACLWEIECLLYILHLLACHAVGL